MACPLLGWRWMTGISPLRAVLCLLWLCAVGAGIAVVLNYQNIRGATGMTPEHWPKGTQLSLDASHDTLLMFAHPKCPCTRASMEELNRILANCHGRVTTHVLFFKPSQFSADWSQTDLQSSAAAIPGVTVQDDLDGKLAEAFGAETSGYVVLYDNQGRLLFHGGVTGSRGHAGDNGGEATVVALIDGDDSRGKEAPVYGCSLLDKSCTREVAAK